MDSKTLRCHARKKRGGRKLFEIKESSHGRCVLMMFVVCISCFCVFLEFRKAVLGENSLLYEDGHGQFHANVS